jgi:hypothetical protein
MIPFGTPAGESPLRDTWLTLSAQPWFTWAAATDWVTHTFFLSQSHGVVGRIQPSDLCLPPLSSSFPRWTRSSPEATLLWVRLSSAPSPVEGARLLQETCPLPTLPGLSPEFWQHCAELLWSFSPLHPVAGRRPTHRLIQPKWLGGRLTLTLALPLPVASNLPLWGRFFPVDGSLVPLLREADSLLYHRLSASPDAPLGVWLGSVSWAAPLCDRHALATLEPPDNSPSTPFRAVTTRPAVSATL